MNKKELVNAVAQKSELSKKDSTLIVEALVGTITEELANGNEVAVTGFGKFSTSVRAARKGRNPSDGTEISIPETTVPKFKAGKKLKQNVKES